jgi:putative oxidoreductase
MRRGLVSVSTARYKRTVQAGEEAMASLDRKLSGFNDIALLIGRILIAALFLIAAYNKFKGLGGTTAYFTKLGFPEPSIFAPVVAIFEALVGVLILVGYQTRCVALAVAVFVVVAALIAHMNFADGNQLNHFMKNLAIAGGCLALFVSGAGAFSVDAKRG